MMIIYGMEAIHPLLSHYGIMIIENDYKIMG